MSNIVVELYDALKEAGVSEEKARAAAAVQAPAENWRCGVDSWFAAIEGRLAAIEGQLVFLRWAMTIYATFNGYARRYSRPALADLDFIM